MVPQTFPSQTSAALIFEVIDCGPAWAPTMTHREASRILRSQKISCKLWQGREETIVTRGTIDHPPAVLDMALKVHFGYEPALQDWSPSRRHDQ